MNNGTMVTCLRGLLLSRQYAGSLEPNYGCFGIGSETADDEVDDMSTEMDGTRKLLG